MKPSLNPCFEQQEPLFFASLKVGKQRRFPWLLSRTEEPICSQKCKFPWEVNVWQLRVESFVDKTTDFKSMEAFKKDRSTWHTKQEANGLSAPLWPWEVWLLSAHPFWLNLPLLSRWCYKLLQQASVRNITAFLVYWWATRLFHSNNAWFLFLTCRNQSVPKPIT